MDMQLTTKSQEALSGAVRRAASSGQAQVEPLHVLGTLLAQGASGEGIAAAVLDRVGVDRVALTSAIQKSLDAMPNDGTDRAVASTLTRDLPRLDGSAGVEPRTRR